MKSLLLLAGWALLALALIIPTNRWVLRVLPTLKGDGLRQRFEDRARFLYAVEFALAGIIAVGGGLYALH